MMEIYPFVDLHFVMHRVFKDIQELSLFLLFKA